MRPRKNLHKLQPENKENVPLSASEEEKLMRGPEDADFSFSFEDQIATGMDRRSLRREEE